MRTRLRTVLSRSKAAARVLLQGPATGPGLYPDGHCHSPIPSRLELDADAPRLFRAPSRSLPGIELDVEGQLRLLEQFAGSYAEQPFADSPHSGLRFGFRNEFFSYSDALFLYSMIRHAKPKRILEVGSGYSSLVSLDTNDRFFASAIRCAFVEPFPGRLRAGLREGEDAEVVEARVQDVSLDRFGQLEAGDLLVVDSTHVGKVGSDVLWVIFEVLPRLAPGVWILFHDLFFPFEYPQRWIEEGRFWNEAYLLRAFLLYNPEFKVRVWNHYLALFHADALQRAMPLCMKNTGASLWLQRV